MAEEDKFNSSEVNNSNHETSSRVLTSYQAQLRGVSNEVTHQTEHLKNTASSQVLNTGNFHKSTANQ